MEGYGDVLPKTIPEIIFTSISMIITCITFGYILNRIGSIFT